LHVGRKRLAKKKAELQRGCRGGEKQNGHDRKTGRLGLREGRGKRPRREGIKTAVVPSAFKETTGETFQGGEPGVVG